MFSILLVGGLSAFRWPGAGCTEARTFARLEQPLARIVYMRASGGAYRRVDLPIPFQAPRFRSRFTVECCTTPNRNDPDQASSRMPFNGPMLAINRISPNGKMSP